MGEKYEAALHWLSNQNEDWLLIIDNADDPDLSLMEFFPKGANGHVLITTRDQDCALGNVGSMSFYGMHETDASELFFKVANVKESAENKSLVRDILSELGHLALAIVVAGSAIHQGYCKLKEYLTYLEGMWRRRRPKRSVSGLDESPEKERFVSLIRLPGSTDTKHKGRPGRSPIRHESPRNQETRSASYRAR